MNRCMCFETHYPDGVHCRWTTDDPGNPPVCYRCRNGHHRNQPAATSGRVNENRSTDVAQA